MEPAWFRALERARDRNVAHPLALSSLREVSDFWRYDVPYQWDGPQHQIASLAECEARGYGACGDAAAFLAAAAKTQGHRVQLCVEAPAGRPDYKHVRIVVDGFMYFDPYSAFRPRGLPPSCERLLEL